ncbi:MAG: hypothetical protein OXH68_06155 [Gammaproteobacteria bacterium]|nr:hypothetical protein [Gammaproteobacteria bacterium]
MRGFRWTFLALRLLARRCWPHGPRLRLAHRLTGLTAMLLAAAAAVAIEPDPYTHRDMDLADSLDVLDSKVNDALDGVAASWDGGEDEWAFVTAVYRRLGSFHWVDPLERWAMDAPEVAKLPTTRRDAVFAKVPLIRAQMARIGLAPTINVNGVYIGTDKIGHFISQGRKFYRRVQRHGSEERAARFTALWEGLIWGRLMSGVYSNADLVANYEGYRFFRGLFHGGMVAGKGPVFHWQSGRPVRQRTFTWADHVNPLWDEMLNPASYFAALVPYLQRRMTRLCDDFARRPERYRIEHFDALSERYRLLGMRDSEMLRPTPYLSAHCPGVGEPGQHAASHDVAVGTRTKPG